MRSSPNAAAGLVHRLVGLEQQPVARRPQRDHLTGRVGFAASAEHSLVAIR
jgi:hypothetical protein